MKKLIAILLIGVFLVSTLGTFALADDDVDTEDDEDDEDEEKENKGKGKIKRKVKIDSDDEEVETELEIEEEEEDETGKNKTKVNLSNGRKAEIKIMPSVASETALERLRLRVCSEENNCTIELKEVGKSEEDRKLAYEIQRERHFKLLGMFRAKALVKAQVDAETGEIIVVKKPWWAFLATEPEENGEDNEENETEDNEENETNGNSSE